MPGRSQGRRACVVITPFGNGCLGSHIDEERSEMRYVMRIAIPCESSNFRTHIAVPVFLGACLLECQRTLFAPVTLVCCHGTVIGGRGASSRPCWNGPSFVNSSTCESRGGLVLLRGVRPVRLRRRNGRVGWCGWRLWIVCSLIFLVSCIPNPSLERSTNSLELFCDVILSNWMEMIVSLSLFLSSDLQSGKRTRRI